MRIFEKITAWALFIVFFYSLVSLILNFLDTDFGYLIPNVTLIFIMTALSGVLVSFSPFWSVDKYLGTNDVIEIVKYETRYRSKFAILLLGYVGILFWLRSKTVFDSMWCMGVLFIIICTICIFVFVFIKDKPKEEV